LKTMMAAFDSVEDAGEAVSAVIAHGLVPATLEMMDQKMMRIIEDFAHAGLPVHAGAALIIEVDGYSESLNGQMDEVIVLLKEHKGYDLRVAQSTEERDKIWYGRKSAAGAMARMSPSYYLLDGTVPRSRLARTLAAINHVCENLELRVSYVFHAGDGNLHPFVLIEDLNNQEVMQRVYEAGERIMKICVGEGGSITGEHGVGTEKRRFMPLMYNAHELGAMHDLKCIFDPQGIFNPGKVFPDHMTVEEQPALKPLSLNLAQPLEPRSAEEASDMIRSLVADGKALRLRGGGTKSSLLSTQPATLSTRQLSGIREFALDDLYVVVGAGTPISELQAELARSKMTVPLLSPWPDATIGGLIATNFNAPLRMRYGNVKDQVMAATVVLPDGRLVRLGRPVVKNVAGYDLPKLFVGSYGTLGLITELALKLAPLPRARLSLVVPVNDPKQGLEWSKQLLQVCLVASALMLCRCDEKFSTAPYTLLYTAEGLPEDVYAELAQARTVLQNAGASGLAQLDQPDGSQAWGDWMRQAEKNTPVVRLGVAPKDLPGLLLELKTLLDDTTYFADLASGQLYVQGIKDLAALRQAALSRGGYAVLFSASPGFAGIGDPWGYAPESLELMRRIKAGWDPAGLFNPGAFLV
jgi:D-lactate dehydrogenase (cytochrome)